MSRTWFFLVCALNFSLSHWTSFANFHFWFSKKFLMLFSDGKTSPETNEKCNKILKIDSVCPMWKLSRNEPDLWNDFDMVKKFSYPWECEEDIITLKKTGDETTKGINCKLRSQLSRKQGSIPKLFLSFTTVYRIPERILSYHEGYFCTCDTFLLNKN